MTIMTRDFSSPRTCRAGQFTSSTALLAFGLARSVTSVTPKITSAMTIRTIYRVRFATVPTTSWARLIIFFFDLPSSIALIATLWFVIMDVSIYSLIPPRTRLMNHTLSVTFATVSISFLRDLSATTTIPASLPYLTTSTATFTINPPCASAFIAIAIMSMTVTIWACHVFLAVTSRAGLLASTMTRRAFRMPLPVTITTLILRLMF